jgi:hypothetical protein
MTGSDASAAEVHRGAMLLQALLREALRVGHSGSRTFVSTVVATNDLKDAFTFIDDHAGTMTAPPGPPREIGDNVVVLPSANPRTC